jgi:hypothetical protein
MACNPYQPSSSTENLAHMRTYPYDCGYSVFQPQQAGPGFAGTPFEHTTVWMKEYLPGVKAATSLEVRSGYPRSSYVPHSQATTLPSDFRLCNQ